MEALFELRQKNALETLRHATKEIDEVDGVEREAR
jgi:hypothetical protein